MSSPILSVMHSFELEIFKSAIFLQLHGFTCGDSQHALSQRESWLCVLLFGTEGLVNLLWKLPPSMPVIYIVAVEELLA